MALRDVPQVRGLRRQRGDRQQQQGGAVPGLQQGAGPGLLLPAVPRLLQRRRLRHRHDGVQRVRGVSPAAATQH